MTVLLPDRIYITERRLAEITFKGAPGSVASARQWAVSVSGLTGDTADSLGLLVSELATNAIRHSRSGDPDGAYTAAVAVSPKSVRVTVTDSGPRPTHPTAPVPRESEPLEPGGLGLAMVATLADDWGSHTTSRSSQVWFQLNTEGGSDAA